MGQFEPNLAQSILGWRGLKVLQIRTIQLPNFKPIFLSKSMWWYNNSFEQMCLLIWTSFSCEPCCPLVLFFVLLQKCRCILYKVRVRWFAGCTMCLKICYKNVHVHHIHVHVYEMYTKSGTCISVVEHCEDLLSWAASTVHGKRADRQLAHHSSRGENSRHR